MLFGPNTVVFGGNYIGILGNAVIFGANKVVFWTHIVVILANSLVFGKIQWYLGEL